MLIQLTEEDSVSQDKNDSEMSHVRQSEKAEKIIKELNDMRGLAKEKVESLIKQLREDKLKDHEIKKVLFARVDFVSRPTLYRALPQEFKREYTKAEPLPKTINVAHKIIDVPEKEQSDHDWHYEQGEKEEERMEKAELEPEEDPKDLEISFLKEKVSELEDALKKTQQFTPATDLEQAPKQTPFLDDEVFKFLRLSADGTHSFWYDAYGIDLFKNRELAQLKNSGVKVFRRLYFEV